MTEIWKPSIDAALEVSNFGRVRSVDRYVACGPAPGKALRRSRVLKPFVLNTGYAQVQGPLRKKHAVHRLVASAFVSGAEPGLVVNHKNGDKLDNHPENLEWITPGENIRHAYRELGRVGWCKGVVSAGHPTSKAIIATNLATGAEAEFACALDAIRAGAAKDSGSISRCCAGKSRSHNGYAFRFARHDVVFGDHTERAA